MALRGQLVRLAVRIIVTRYYKHSAEASRVVPLGVGSDTLQGWLCKDGAARGVLQGQYCIYTTMETAM